jgi:hypothetical protein
MMGSGLGLEPLEDRPEHHEFLFPARVDLGRGPHGVEGRDHQEEVVEENVLDPLLDHADVLHHLSDRRAEIL